MTAETEIAALERQVRELERLPQVRARTDQALDRADRVMGNLGPTRTRDLEAMGRTFADAMLRAGLAIGLVSLVTIGIGLFVPIGLFGFLAAVGIAIGLAALAVFFPRETGAAMGEISDKIGGLQLVRRFDQFLVRARRDLPNAARAELDALRQQVKGMGDLLERSEGEPEAADARRLMSKHLPLLIEHYEQVPRDFRDTRDNEGLTVEQRLVDGLRSGRRALDEIGESLSKKHVDALETQGRFLKNRYGSNNALD